MQVFEIFKSLEIHKVIGNYAHALFLSHKRSLPVSTTYTTQIKNDLVGGQVRPLRTASYFKDKKNQNGLPAPALHNCHDQNLYGNESNSTG